MKFKSKLSSFFFAAGSLYLSAAAQQTSTPSAPVQPATIPSLQTTVVVLGNPDTSTEGETSRVVSVLDTQQHPLAFHTIEDYLRTDASVDIQQRGASDVQSDISVRGASFEQTLVLLNGLRVDDAETAHFNLDLPVPLQSIGSIDVLHGSGSTLYGSDAIGGVVDFLTLKPQETSLKLRAGFGSFGENQQSFLGTVAGRKWSEVLAGSRDYSDGFIPDRDYRSSSAMSETRYQSALGESDVLFAGSDRPYGADQFYGAYNSFERTKGWFAALQQEFGKKTNAAVAYRRHSDIFILLRDNPGYYKNQHIDESWQGVLRRRESLGHFGTLSYGLEENTDQIQSNSLGQHGRNRGAGYVNLDMRSTKGTLSLGLREEVLSGGRSVTSPSVGGSLWVHRTVKVRASVGYGFRLPTYVDLYYSDPTTIGNSNLKPESAWNYDGGVDWYPNAHTAGSLTIFYSHQTNAIDYLRPSPAYKWQASNLSGLRFTGVESSFAWRPNTRQQVKVTWTALFGAQDALNGMQSEYVFNYPVNNIGAEWTGTARQGIMLRTRVGVTQRYQQTAYPVWDISLARETGRIRPYLQMTNLSNTGYQEIIGVRMPGRSFVGGVEFDLRRGHQ